MFKKNEPAPQINKIKTKSIQQQKSAHSAMLKSCKEAINSTNIELNYKSVNILK